MTENTQELEVKELFDQLPDAHEFEPLKGGLKLISYPLFSAIIEKMSLKAHHYGKMEGLDYAGSLLQESFK
jgi:hypothetical protein